MNRMNRMKVSKIDSIFLRKKGKFEGTLVAITHRIIFPLFESIGIF